MLIPRSSLHKQSKKSPTNAPEHRPHAPASRNGYSALILHRLSHQLQSPKNPSTPSDLRQPITAPRSLPASTALPRPRLNRPRHGLRLALRLTGRGARSRLARPWGFRPRGVRAWMWKSILGRWSLTLALHFDTLRRRCSGRESLRLGDFLSFTNLGSPHPLTREFPGLQESGDIGVHFLFPLGGSLTCFYFDFNRIRYPSRTKRGRTF